MINVKNYYFEFEVLYVNDDVCFIKSLCFLKKNILYRFFLCDCFVYLMIKLTL